MNDDRMIQRLEEQLREAHATNADLRDRLEDIEARERAAGNKLSEAEIHMRQLEKSHAKQKAAEENGAEAQRKCDDAERRLLRARGEIEELHERLTRAQAEADQLSELNARIETARHAGDLFSRPDHGTRKPRR
jgi:chromosome segregation ATPase